MERCISRIRTTTRQFFKLNTSHAPRQPTPLQPMRPLHCRTTRRLAQLCCSAADRPIGGRSRSAGRRQAAWLGRAGSGRPGATERRWVVNAQLCFWIVCGVVSVGLLIFFIWLDFQPTSSILPQRRRAWEIKNSPSVPHEPAPSPFDLPAFWHALAEQEGGPADNPLQITPEVWRWFMADKPMDAAKYLAAYAKCRDLYFNECQSALKSTPRDSGVFGLALAWKAGPIRALAYVNAESPFGLVTQAQVLEVFPTLQSKVEQAQRVQNLYDLYATQPK